MSSIKIGSSNVLTSFGIPNNDISFSGQFLYRKVSLERKKTLKNGRTRGRLKVHGNTRKPRKVVASLGRRLNLATNSKVECWMVSHNGKRLLDGNYMDYINRRNVTDYINKLGGG